MNIVEPILFQARHNPPAPAMCAPGGRLELISYGRLERFINAIGRQALVAGITSGHVVAIQVKEHIFHAAITLALANIGVATVSVREPRFPVGLRIDAFITDNARAARSLHGIEIIPADMAWTSGDASLLDDRQLYRGAGEAICRISFTSGSTGEAKAVAFSHAMQAARLARYNHAY